MRRSWRRPRYNGVSRVAPEHFLIPNPYNVSQLLLSKPHRVQFSSIPAQRLWDAQIGRVTLRAASIFSRSSRHDHSDASNNLKASSATNLRQGQFRRIKETKWLAGIAHKRYLGGQILIVGSRYTRNASVTHGCHAINQQSTFDESSAIRPF